MGSTVRPFGPRARRIALSGAVVALAAACGIDDRIVQVGSPVDDAISRFALSNCDRTRQCIPGYLHRNYGTYDECVARTVLNDQWIAGLPGVSWDAAAFSQCADAWDNASCDAVFSLDPLPGCRHDGTRAIGQPCNSTLQCASNFCKQTGYACGTCAAQPGVGAPCSGDWDCGDKAYCAPDQTCQIAGQLNDSCSTNRPCEGQFSCANGVCVVTLQAGAHCDAAAGLTCDFVDKELSCSSSTCASISPRNSGEACGAGTYCAKLGVCTGGTCVAAPSENGGACDASKGLYCEWPALCVNGACQMPVSPAAAVCTG